MRISDWSSDVCSSDLQSSDNQETSSIPEGQRDSQDIVVTAQKRASRLADVPAAISAFSGAYIEERGVSDFEGIVEQTPGVSITSDFGGSASKVISVRGLRSEEHTSELQSLMRISYAVFCLKKTK